jgi:hypothetical protein
MDDILIESAKHWLSLVHYSKSCIDWCILVQSSEVDIWKHQYDFALFKFNETMNHLTHVVSPDILQGALQLVLLRLQ